MAIILPNTSIILCKDVPLDSTYEHTVSFANSTAAYNYFYSKRFVVIEENSYQRVLENKLRIACTMEQAIQCNYMMFKNTNFENKWIYAFITGWQYINNVTTEITYEIDVFQTFWNDTRLLNVFVEREHSVTDNIGDNLVEEGLATGEYMLDGYVADEYAEDIAIVFWCTFVSTYTGEWPNGSWSFTRSYGYFQNRTFSGLTPIAFRSTTGDVEKIANWLANIPTTFQDGIVSATLIPRASIIYAWNPEEPPPGDYTLDIAKTDHYAYMQRSDGLAIKNKKLYTFPYTFLYVTAYNGVNANYMYEFFDSNYCQFNIIGDVSPEPSQCVVPVGYKGLGINADEMLTLSGFPQVSWDADVFKAWLAQNASNIASVAIGLAGAVATGGATLATAAAPHHPYFARPGSHAYFSGKAKEPVLGNMGQTMDLVGSSMSPISGVLSLLVGGVMAWNTPPQARGNNGKYLMHKAMLDHFGFYNKHIRPEYVTIIDDYFNMFGYATRRVKIPNLASRPYWNYVKTIGHTVDGISVPDPFIQVMNDAFNKGITIWHNPDYVGNYTLNNSPQI